MHLPVNRITMSKLPICTPAPWENIMSICNSKRVPPPTRDLKYFLHIDPRKDLESVTHKNSKWIPSISHTDHNLNQFCELGAKEHTWLCGTLTCTGEQRSSLSPTPTCPNCKIEKVLTISTHCTDGVYYETSCLGIVNAGQAKTMIGPAQRSIGPQAQHAQQTNCPTGPKVYARTAVKAAILFGC